MPYRLLSRFRGTFESTRYRHRDSSLGDKVAVELYEDLLRLGRSPSFNRRVTDGTRAVNARSLLRGIAMRRGDGTFGEAIPRVPLVHDQNYSVPRAQLATVEIGVEVKILFKAMIKQIDRVITTSCDQAENFRKKGTSAICIGIVGINFAPRCVGYEGDRAFPTDGGKYKHPIQEANGAEMRLLARARACFDEFLVLRFRAKNEAPFEFEWVDAEGATLDYGAVLTRIAVLYQKRFGN